MSPKALWGFSSSSVGKESACSAGNLGSISELGRSPGGGHATHSSILAWKIPKDRGTWWAAVHGVSKSWTRLSTKLCGIFFFFLLMFLTQYDTKNHCWLCYQKFLRRYHFYYFVCTSLNSEGGVCVSPWSWINEVPVKPRKAGISDLCALLQWWRIEIPEILR